ncbi:hypothetical protein SeLEV6574_g07663 [Synchytrium endobioticum]|uniref:Uncharacterized protein n=1 Tax=Synchytrium endobioticum TaxID=286115 RepID=A0A507CH60_9FUNG|nr:hypothetical protein SeLEV6574_g07663 [Synchytrium endobioticum]
MSRLSKIHIVILIAVFLVHRIQAADDSEMDKMKMRDLSFSLMRHRITSAEETEKAQVNDDAVYLKAQMRCLSARMRERLNYVPLGSLRLDELSRVPAPGDSEERQIYVMEFNAYQYEYCEALRFRISNALGIATDTRPLVGRKTVQSVKKYSQKLAPLMKRRIHQCI